MYEEFENAKKMLREATGYRQAYTFDEWKNEDPEKQAAILFIQYFPEITLAWTKAKSYDGDECEAVSIALQYLQKNVKKIMEDPKRFKASYIYRVAYNCLYCICHDRLCDKNRREYEVFALQKDDEGEVYSLLDSYIQEDGDAESVCIREWFWEEIQSMGEDVIQLVENLISGNILFVENVFIINDEKFVDSKRKAKALMKSIDSISTERRDWIVSNIKTLLASYFDL